VKYLKCNVTGCDGSAKHVGEQAQMTQMTALTG